MAAAFCFVALATDAAGVAVRTAAVDSAHATRIRGRRRGGRERKETTGKTMRRASSSSSSCGTLSVSYWLDSRSVGSCTVEGGREGEARKHHIDRVFVQNTIAMTVPEG